MVLHGPHQPQVRRNILSQLDPTHLWVDQGGRTNQEQIYFTQKFGGFFRINQIILTTWAFYLVQTVPMKIYYKNPTFRKFSIYK